MPQEQDQSTTWHQNMSADTMVGVGDVDFTKYLDLDTNFEQFHQSDDYGAHTGLDTPMARLAFGSNGLQNLPDHADTNMQNMGMIMMANDHMNHNYSGMRSEPQQPHQFQQYPNYPQMHAHHHPYHVPPTPVSGDMQAAKYAQQVEHTGQMILDRGQASFTPLVSPAQTPLDNTFCMPDYVPVDDFFSPLTSPAIEAQPPFHSTNATASPIELNSDSPNANFSSRQPSKRTRRKVNSAQTRATARSVRQSPAMKPQSKRRQFSLSSVPTEKIESVLENLSSDGVHPASTQTNAIASSEDSVSPEPLSEMLMRPPPVPLGTAKSPAYALAPKTNDDNMPATPAMLMRIPGKKAGPNDAPLTSMLNNDVLEDIVLPDAAATGHPRILTSSSTIVSATDGQSTPTSLTKTPKLSADSTPRSSAVKIQSNSQESVDKLKRPDTRIGNRAGKKRMSVSSVATSPALRPKISPSISPLVPSTSSGMPHISAETSALYLASKSNYQNILDGTHLPGVSYPDTLAENLSSKRTSHKIAEQGRRNRINLALKEIESLLPPSIMATGAKGKSANSSAKEAEEDSPDKPSGGAQGASKASTVEMAIVYIRSLQAELKATQEKLSAAEKVISEVSNGQTAQKSSSEPEEKEE